MFGHFDVGRAQMYIAWRQFEKFSFVTAAWDEENGVLVIAGHDEQKKPIYAATITREGR